MINPRRHFQPTLPPTPASGRFPSTDSVRLLLFLGALLATLPGRAQTPAIAPAPDWVQPSAWTAPAKPEPNSSGQDYLLLDDQVRVATEENYHHQAYQIVNDNGRQHGSQVHFNFDPSFQTLTIHHLRLVRNGVASDRLDPAKIQVLQQERDLDRQLYNGERSAFVILDDVRIGDVIDLAYTLKGRNPVFGGQFVDSFYVEWGVPVRDLRYRMLIPDGRRIHHRQVPPRTAAKTEPVSRAVEGGTELTWRRTNIPIIENEERVPASHHVFSFVDVSEFASWAAIVEWARPLYALDPRPQPLLDAAVAEIRRKGTTPEELAVAALALVQEEIRYLGIEMGPGSHRPSEPEEVLRRRFGDCKDKTRLLTALLQRLDLPACPALVHSEREGAVHERLPSPYAFDHVIVSVRVNGRHYLLDPTLSYQRGDKLALRHIGTYGPYLRIAPGSEALEDAMLVDGDVSRTTVRLDYQVDQLEQPATLVVSTTAEGRAADSLRSYFANTSIEQIGREYLDYYTRFHRGITQQAPVEHSDNPATNTYTVRERYRIDGLFAPDTDRKVLRAEFEPAGIWDYVRPPNLAQRRQPYALSYPVQSSEVITVNLPEKWTITPQDEKVEDDAFILSFKASNPAPKSVQLAYTWTARKSRVEPDRLAAFSANMDRARRKLGYQLSWNKDADESPVAQAPGFQMNWPMLLVALGTLGACFLAARQLIRTPNPRPPEPPVLEPAPASPLAYGKPRESVEGLGGWLILVAFGLILRPIILLSTLVQNREGYLNLNVWRISTTPGSDNYNEHFAWLIPVEIIVNMVLFSYSVLLIILFFRRSHLFPRTMQVFLGVLILTALFGVWEDSLLGTTDTMARAASYRNLAQVLVASAVWIPYFSVSRRVKATFVR
jgi:transglutaminase-like putative cysteine protease